MNKQDVFNEVADHLARQKRGSMIFSEHQIGNNCVYRDGRGGACAVGCLIPNEEYTHQFEGSGVAKLRGMVQQRVEAFPILSQRMEHHYLLNELQMVHDLAAGPLDTDLQVVWGRGLIDVARNHALEFDAVAWLANVNNPNYVVEKNFDVGSK